jgi:hypothetical protein
MSMIAAAFLIGLVVDSIPIISPPAWSILVILILKYDANPWVVVVAGVLGSTLGRLLLSQYIPYVAKWLVDGREQKNLQYLGKRLDGGYWKTSLFVFLYTLTPLSSTALFTAAGMGRANPLYLLPPFAAGKLISDAVMVFSGKYAASNVRNMLHGKISPTAVVGLVVGLLLIGAIMFIDWRELLEKKRLRFRFKIWKRRGAA